MKKSNVKLVESKTDAKDVQFFNLFYRSTQTTFLIGVFGQFISGLTELASIFLLCGGTLPLFQISNIAPVSLGLIAIYIFEIIGVRQYLVNIVRQIVNRNFSNTESLVLLGLNILFCGVLCFGNIYTSIIGQKSLFHTKTNIRTTDYTFGIDSAKLAKIEALEIQYNHKDSVLTASYERKQEATILEYDKLLSDLKNNRWAVRLENKAKYRYYTRKIDETNNKKQDKISTLESTYLVSKSNLQTEKKTAFNRINTAYDERKKDLKDKIDSDVNLYALIQDYTLPLLIFFIILAWVAIVYQEVFYKGSQQDIVIEKRLKRPNLLVVFFTGLYDMIYHTLYKLVTKTVGTTKYQYTIIKQDFQTFDSREYLVNGAAQPSIATNKNKPIGFRSGQQRNTMNVNDDTNTDNESKAQDKKSTVNDERDGKHTNDTTSKIKSNTRNCKHCGTPFTYKHWNKQYCSDGCRIAAWERRTGKTFSKGKKA